MNSALSGAKPPMSAEPGAAGKLRRKHVRQQRHVEQVHSTCARENVRPAFAVICRERLFRARIGSVFRNDCNQIANIPDAKVQALRADRREDMGGFADQRDAVLREADGQGCCERIDLPAGLDGNAPEHRLHLLLDATRQRCVVEFGQFCRGVRLYDPDEA